MTKRDQIQADALAVALRHRRSGLGVSMGVGKTLIGLRYIAHHQQESIEKLRVLVVAPKLSIFDSWRSDADRFNISLDGVEFTTYLSLNKKNPYDYDVVVFDECHSLLNVHTAFLGPYTGLILGLTGTPPRHLRSEKGQMVMRYCPIMFSYITDDAVGDKILNDYRIYVHLMPLNTDNTVEVKTAKANFRTSERKSYDYWTERLANAPNKKMEQISAVMRMRIMMDFKTKEEYAREMIENIEDKCIIFCNTQEQAERLCTHSYHSNNPNAEENLQDFKDGRIDKLSCVLQLNEGINIPHLKVGIILHAYGNERKSAQRIGRLLRLNPDETATVHILCYKNTVDEKWVREALKDLDEQKIKYYEESKHLQDL